MDCATDHNGRQSGANDEDDDDDDDADDCDDRRGTKKTQNVCTDD